MKYEIYFGTEVETTDNLKHVTSVPSRVRGIFFVVGINLHIGRKAPFNVNYNCLNILPSSKVSLQMLEGRFLLI